jgi:hypothetical protein
VWEDKLVFISFQQELPGFFIKSGFGVGVDQETTDDAQDVAEQKQSKNRVSSW